MLFKRLVVLAFLAAAIVWGGGAIAGIAPGQPYVPGEVIIRLNSDLTTAQKTAFYNEMRSQQKVEFKGINAELRHLNGMTVEAAIARYQHDPRVRYIEPNYIVHAYTTPNDPMYASELWGMNNTGQAPTGGRAGTPGADISAPEAWSVYTGTHDVLVCIIDTGLNYTHPDLAANVWTNPGEIPGNGIDDDGNGYIDDIHGWDFANNDNDPMDDNGHGSHCAGTIGGVGNNGIGVTGVNWNVSIASAKFLDSGGSGTLANGVLAILYATTLHPDVMSNSWGGGGFTQSMYDAIEAANAQDIFFVAAAGNSGDDNDVTPHYPSSYANANVIAVMATDMDDLPVNEAGWWATCYGATSVDIAAPGLFIWSTVLGTAYDNYSGTSMATPHVSGAMAMLRGRFPTISVAAGKSLLLTVGNDVLPSLAGKCVSGARLNLLKLIADPDTTAPAQITDLAATDLASNWIRLGWTATGDDGSTGTATAYDLRYSTSPIDDTNWASATKVTNLPNPQVAGSPETFRVNGLTASTLYYFAIKAGDEYGNMSPLSNVPSATTLGAPTVSVSPTSMSASLSTGGTTDQILTVSNVGEGILDFTIPGADYMMPSKARFATQPQHEYVELAKGAEDTRPGMAPAKASGGPDAFGHRWRDSDDVGGPAFNWIDISTIGTAIPLSSDDQNLGPFPIGFSFPYYGNNFSNFQICSNGWVSFTATTTSYSNVALPAAGAPGNMLALYWDDLTFAASGDAFYYYDGTRLIIEYLNVPSYGTGGPYTMEIQIYPSGVIEYHYLSVGSSVSSATIGIQDATGADGLTVVYNAAYLHDNMAIRFSALPPWLSTSPNSGSVAAGASVDVTVTYDATGLCGSHFDANLHVMSNDPVTPNKVVPVGLDLTGTPDIQLAPAALAFGSVYITASKTLNLTVANGGCADLHVTGLTIDNVEFTSGVVLPDTLIAGGTLVIPVVYTPVTAGPVSGTLTLTSDDPDSPSIAVPLSGTGLDFPNIKVAPTSLSTTLPTGGTDDKTLTVSNTGAGVLNFTIPEPDYQSAAKAPVPQGAPYVELAKGAVDPREGTPQLLGSGGPDAFGYRWKDSDEPGGPAFNWIEINALGTPVTLTDDSNQGPFPIGFSMPFYGNTFTTFQICSNGWVSFSSTSTSLSNSGLPATGAPFDLLALFWDDLNPSLGGNVYYYNDGTRLIIEYKDVPHYSSGGPYSMQVQLYPSGRIEYHYLSMATPLNGATIGIQNSTGTDGLQVNYNVDYVHDNMAIRFQATPPWLSALPATGAINPGQSVDVTVHFDAADLCGDAYHANIHVLSNDPDSPDVVVPATLNLIGQPDAQLSAASLDFGSIYLTQTHTLPLTVANAGCASLQLSGLSIDNGVFTMAEAAPQTVPVGGSVTLHLTFAPIAAGPATGTLTITSNDPDQPTLTASLAGVGVETPVVGVAPTSVVASVPQNTTATRTLTINNTGAGTMNWSIPSPDISSKQVPAIDPANNWVELPKGEKDPRTGGPVLDGSGGPDASGYRWIDSDSPGGPTFSWIDISTTGTVAISTGDDTNAGPFNIGFPFKFYDNQFTTFRVCSNGFMSFSSSATAYTNSGLPSTSAPFDLLAPFWDDLNVTGGAKVVYQVVGGNLVVEWVAVPPYTGTGTNTFEVIITPGRKITFQYLTLGSTTGSSTVGIQNSTGTVGLQCAFNAAYLHTNMAIQFSALPQWLSAFPTSGTIPPHSSADVTVTLDANGVELGDHAGALRVLSNDIHTPEVQIPVTMTVVDITGVTTNFVPKEHSLSQNVPNPAHGQALITFGLMSRTKADLRVYDVRGALVRTLVSRDLPAGVHSVTWDGRTDRGTEAASGVYFYKLRTDTREFVRRMSLVK